MFERFTYILGQRVPSYSIILIVGAIATLLWIIANTPKSKRLATLDILLISLLSAVIVGRVVHVLISWVYYTENLNEIWRIYQRGGINWHGAVVGGLSTAYVIGKWRKLDVRKLLDNLALPIAIMALAGWWACSVAYCAYGAEVQRMSDYPQGVTWDAYNLYGLQAPRFAVQRLGMWFSRLLILLLVILHWRGWLKGYRLWISLLAVSSISCGLGFLRGDTSTTLGILRIEQWLDIAMIVASMGMILAQRFSTMGDENNALPTNE